MNVFFFPTAPRLLSYDEVTSDIPYQKLEGHDLPLYSEHIYQSSPPQPPTTNYPIPNPKANLTSHVGYYLTAPAPPPDLTQIPREQINVRDMDQGVCPCFSVCGSNYFLVVMSIFLYLVMGFGLLLSDLGAFEHDPPIYMYLVFFSLVYLFYSASFIIPAGCFPCFQPRVNAISLEEPSTEKKRGCCSYSKAVMSRGGPNIHENIHHSVQGLTISEHDLCGKLIAASARQPRFYFLIECYHTRTVTSTSTDSQGNTSTTTSTETVYTFQAERDIEIVGFADNAPSPDAFFAALNESANKHHTSSPNVQFTSSYLLSPDQQVMLDLMTLEVEREFEHLDSSIDVTVLYDVDFRSAFPTQSVRLSNSRSSSCCRSVCFSLVFNRLWLWLSMYTITYIFYLMLWRCFHPHFTFKASKYLAITNRVVAEHRIDGGKELYDMND